MDGERRAVRAMIEGRVQGVGYRAWTEREARALGLDGWVRNRLDGTVEALFAGPAPVVDRMLALCRKGPAPARVERVSADPDDDPGAGTGFEVRRTV